MTSRYRFVAQMSHSKLKNNDNYDTNLLADKLVIIIPVSTATINEKTGSK